MISLALLIAACGEEDEAPTLDVTDEAPAEVQQESAGIFTSFAHSLDGSARLYGEKDGQRVLRLENFTMTPGPDVYVYLSKSNNYSRANVLEVAMLKNGYSKSNINFTFASGSYTPEHKYVLVYCVQFSSLFGYAELK